MKYELSESLTKIRGVRVKGPIDQLPILPIRLILYNSMFVFLSMLEFDIPQNIFFALMQRPLMSGNGMVQLLRPAYFIIPSPPRWAQWNLETREKE